MGETYNITISKAQKLLMAFPGMIMYCNGPPGSLMEEFVKPFKSCGYVVVSVDSLRRICRSGEDAFIAGLHKRISEALEKDVPILIYGYMDLVTLELVFVGAYRHFRYIYIYPTAAGLRGRVNEKLLGSPSVVGYCGKYKPSSGAILKKHSEIYRTHLEQYEKMLVVLEDD
jgi:hypothetical protein